MFQYVSNVNFLCYFSTCQRYLFTLFCCVFFWRNIKFLKYFGSLNNAYLICQENVSWVFLHLELYTDLKHASKAYLFSLLHWRENYVIWSFFTVGQLVRCFRYWVRYNKFLISHFFWHFYICKFFFRKNTIVLKVGKTVHIYIIFKKIFVILLS